MAAPAQRIPSHNASRAASGSCRVLVPPVPNTWVVRLSGSYGAQPGSASVMKPDPGPVHRVGDGLRGAVAEDRGGKDVTRLSTAFFAELERRFVPS
ncbi:MAG TPA: hypothetical protein VGO74_04030 [Modestobacter sp.]|nr:hypothetical protein [Modestobacter sp.]